MSFVVGTTYRTWETERGSTSLGVPAPDSADPRRAPRARTSKAAPASEYVSEPHAERPREGGVLGSYRLVEELGRGATGQVFVAEHIRLLRRVAIKVLHPSLMEQRAAMTRFCREARIMARIRHPNVLLVEDLVEPSDGPPYMVMELLAGCALGDVIRTGAAVSSIKVLEIGIQLCAALEVCHDLGIVHRDLSPGNVFLCDDRNAPDTWIKLLDFGIAKVPEKEASLDEWTQVTASGAIIGTPAYMSPEQAAGAPVEPRSDLYSLGAILYQLAAGQPVATGKSLADFLRAHLMHRPPAIRETPLGYDVAPELDAIVMRCLAKNPGERPSTATALRKELSALREALTAQRRRPRARRRAAVAASALGAAALLGCTLWRVADLRPDWRSAGAATSVSAVVDDATGSAGRASPDRHYVQLRDGAAAVLAPVPRSPRQRTGREFARRISAEEEP